MFIYGLLICALLVFVFQNHIIYNCGGGEWLMESQRHPPLAFGLPNPRAIRDNGELPAGTITAFERPGSDTVIYYFHGNGRRMEHDYWRIGQLYGVCNCSIYAIEYPHCLETKLFGHSMHDYRMWLSRLLGVHLQAGKRNYLLGASLGTAFVISAYPYTWSIMSATISGVILENPFTTVAAVISPSYATHVEAFLLNSWDNSGVLSLFDTKVPVLFLTSEHDEITPPHMSTTLHDMWSAHSKKTRVLLKGSLHGHAASHPDYLPAVVEFLKEKNAEA